MRDCPVGKNLILERGLKLWLNHPSSLYFPTVGKNLILTRGLKHRPHRLKKLSYSVGKNLILARGLKRLLDKRLIISVRKNLILARGLKSMLVVFSATGIKIVGKDLILARGLRLDHENDCGYHRPSRKGPNPRKGMEPLTNPAICPLFGGGNSEESNSRKAIVLL